MVKEQSVETVGELEEVSVSQGRCVCGHRSPWELTERERIAELEGVEVIRGFRGRGSRRGEARHGCGGFYNVLTYGLFLRWIQSQPSSSSLEDRLDRPKDGAGPLSKCILSTYCAPGTQLDTTVVEGARPLLPLPGRLHIKVGVNPKQAD